MRFQAIFALINAKILQIMTEVVRRCLVMADKAKQAVLINGLKPFQLLLLISLVLGDTSKQDTLNVNLGNARVPGGITLNFNHPFRDVIFNTVEKTRSEDKCGYKGAETQKTEPSENAIPTENGNPKEEKSKNTVREKGSGGPTSTPQAGRLKIVAFHATLTDGDLGPSYEERLVKFNHVDLNLGGAYDSKSGKFTAPEAGVYKFSVNALQKNGYQIFLSIKKQGKDYAEIHSSGVRYDSHSATVLMQLEKGQMVWVELQPSRVYAVYGQGKYTSFCGHLLSRF